VLIFDTDLKRVMAHGVLAPYGICEKVKKETLYDEGLRRIEKN